MDCLKNYIGLKYCSSEPPGSNIFINILPGMSTELADNIANSEQVTFAQVWNDVQDRAIMRLKNDIINNLLTNEKADFRSVIYHTRKLLKYQRDMVAVPALAEYRGVYLTLPLSRYVNLRVNEIYIFSKEIIDVATEFKVFDINDGVELYSKDIIVSPGLNTISIGKIFDLKYEVFELFLGIDCSAIETIETMPDYFGWYDNQDAFCGSSCRMGTHGTGYLQVQPAVLPVAAIGNIIFESLILTGVGKGVVVGCEILCSIEQFICENIHHFQQSFLYLLGAEMLQQKLSSGVGSSRMNWFTSTNLEQTDNTRLIFESRYVSNLKREVKSIPLSGESACFSCEDTLEVSTRGALP